ncbi:MAG: hypothetical protein EZS28_005018 [Streblomastix strix]|uniref:RPGR-interacting protein 1 first C2 domain-containing protein n=1 Tax=Streblomastix strix TaxID=222440 RepID=A0A5J4WZ19_9EUKA|nr:MAG: hypothetical protein EZS28_005018 [Streblomastix strix]
MQIRGQDQDMNQQSLVVPIYAGILPEERQKMEIKFLQEKVRDAEYFEEENQIIHRQYLAATQELKQIHEKVAQMEQDSLVIQAHKAADNVDLIELLDSIIEIENNDQNQQQQQQNNRQKKRNLLAVALEIVKKWIEFRKTKERNDMEGNNYELTELINLIDGNSKNVRKNAAYQRIKLHNYKMKLKESKKRIKPNFRIKIKNFLTDNNILMKKRKRMRRQFSSLICTFVGVDFFLFDTQHTSQTNTLQPNYLTAFRFQCESSPYFLHYLLHHPAEVDFCCLDDEKVKYIGKGYIDLSSLVHSYRTIRQKILIKSFNCNEERDNEQDETICSLDIEAESLLPFAVTTDNFNLHSIKAKDTSCPACRK